MTEFEKLSLKHILDVFDIVKSDFSDCHYYVSPEGRGQYEACLRNLDRQVNFLKDLYNEVEDD